MDSDLDQVLDAAIAAEASSLRDDPLIGRVLGGKFKLRSRVGAGASGSVYQADQTTLGRTVAVKVLNPELAQDPRLVKRFHDEALAASRLNHPNTVSVIDYGQANDDVLFIVMEYLRGVTLTQLILEELPLDSERIVDIMSQILSGLEEAHHCGVIHADLKADNIVVEHRHGGWDLVKVVDFGIARLIEKPRDEESKKTICGTPEYMSPELISGSDPTVASDLYAVGVLLYELLCGVTPFGGGETLAVLTRHLREQPTPPGERDLDFPVNRVLERIALKALAKRPADRFASASDFRESLELALDEELTEKQSELTCKSCGAEVPSRFKFCPECGASMASVRADTDVSSRTLVTPTSMSLVEFSSTLGGASDYDDDDDSIWPLPLMGREDVIDQLNAFLRTDDGGIIQVVGGTGSGRSRLLRDLRAQVRKSDDFEIYRSGPDPTGLAATFYPIRKLISRALGLPARITYDNLSRAVTVKGLTWRDVPGMAELFGFHGELWQLEAAVRRREVFAAAARALELAASQDSVVMVLENVDQYDDPSKELLLHLAERESEVPLRFICSNGPVFAERWPESVQRVEVQSLTSDDLLALAVYLEDVDVEQVPSATLMMQLTAGHAAHVHHLVRLVVEGQSVQSAPTNLADLISERFKLLPHPARVVCQAAAVFGDEVARNTLFKALHGRLDAPLDAALAFLKSRGLLVENRKTGYIAFASRLVREIAYDATPAELRRELHIAAAESLELAAASPLILGHQHDMAGNLLQATTFLGQAGDDAVRQMNDAGATLLYHRALDAARKLMLSDADRESRSRFVTLSVKLAEALRVSDQANLARGVVEEAKGYSDGNPALDAQLLQAAAHLSLCEDKSDVAVATMQRGIGLLMMVGNTELLAEMYLDLSAIHLSRKDRDVAISELSEGLNLVTMGEGKNATTGPTILWRLLLRLAQLHGENDDHDRALELAESALIHARRIRSRIGSARVQAALASIYESVGNLVMANQYRAAAVNEMRRLGDRRGTAELLLAHISPTRTLVRVDPEELREAHQLASEVGWNEGLVLVEKKNLDIKNM